MIPYIHDQSHKSILYSHHVLANITMSTKVYDNGCTCPICDKSLEQTPQLPLVTNVTFLQYTCQGFIKPKQNVRIAYLTQEQNGIIRCITMYVVLPFYLRCIFLLAVHNYDVNCNGLKSNLYLVITLQTPKKYQALCLWSSRMCSHNQVCDDNLAFVPSPKPFINPHLYEESWNVRK